MRSETASTTSFGFNYFATLVTFGSSLHISLEIFPNKTFKLRRRADINDVYVTVGKEKDSATAAMSTGKRLAKRSILGSKVMVPGQDGKHYPGHIQAVKQSEDGNAR